MLYSNTSGEYDRCKQLFSILTSRTGQIFVYVLSPTAVHKVLRSKYLNDEQFSASQEDVAEAIK
jgi:hypothetical protein